MRECAVMFAVVSDARPERWNVIPVELYELLCACWTRDPGARPAIADVCKVLRVLRVRSEGDGSRVESVFER